MKNNLLVRALEQLDDDLVLSFDPQLSRPQKRLAGWQRGLALAACLGLVCLIAVRFFSPKVQLGGSGGALMQNLAPGQLAGVAEIPSFMAYAGPVLPLTILEAGSDLSVQRLLSFDWSKQKGAAVRVTDTYQLSNPTAHDLQLTAVYPLISSLAQLQDKAVAMQLDGQALDFTTQFGSYTSGFTALASANGPKEDLTWLEDFTGYQQLLADGSYFAAALAEKENFDLPVTVYEITDLASQTGQGQAPSLAVNFHKDAQTIVLSYGFHGLAMISPEEQTQGFALPQGEWIHFPWRYCLISIGGELRDIELQGYENMGFNKGEEIKIEARLFSSKTTLRSISRELFLHHFSVFDEYNSIRQKDASPAQLELLYEAAYDFLLSYGPLASDPVQRYASGALEDFFGESSRAERVLYLAADITVPADSSVELTCSQVQAASYDMSPRKNSIKDVWGYDLATRLGSNLSFTRQEVLLLNLPRIDLVQTNLQLQEAENGLTAELDLATDYYYLLLRKNTRPD